jgi:hypothetical protein
MGIFCRAVSIANCVEFWQLEMPPPVVSIHHTGCRLCDDRMYQNDKRGVRKLNMAAAVIDD